MSRIFCKWLNNLSIYTGDLIYFKMKVNTHFIVNLPQNLNQLLLNTLYGLCSVQFIFIPLYSSYLFHI